ncbi:hypothetical protein N7453_004614 [Penicillium expansum]|nr:hypothetical protein N7453_004614 [Penicillium expansum]
MTTPNPTPLILLTPSNKAQYLRKKRPFEAILLAPNSPSHVRHAESELARNALREIIGVGNLENLTLDLPCRRVFERGQSVVEIIGPLVEEWEGRVVEDSRWYWGIRDYVDMAGQVLVLADDNVMITTYSHGMKNM